MLEEPVCVFPAEAGERVPGIPRVLGEGSRGAQHVLIDCDTSARRHVLLPQES